MKKSKPSSSNGLFISWIGKTDLNAAAGDPEAGLGPIAQALTLRSFSRLVLLSNYSPEQTQPYLDWLRQRTEAPLDFRLITLSSPMHFGEIYQAARRVLSELTTRLSTAPALTIHLSPGTSAMAAVWILLAKTRFPAELIQSSVEKGVEVAQIPFDIAAEFLPDLLHQADRRLADLSAGEPPERAEFSKIIREF